jgi:hypothetical protein
MFHQLSQFTLEGLVTNFHRFDIEQAGPIYQRLWIGEMQDLGKHNKN